MENFETDSAPKSEREHVVHRHGHKGNWGGDVATAFIKFRITVLVS